MGKDCCAGKKVCCPPKNAKAAAAKNAAPSTAAPSKAAKKGAAAAKHVEEEEEDDDIEFDEDDIIHGDDIDRAAMAKMMVEGLKAKAAANFELLPLPMKIKISALKKLQADYDENRKTFQDEIYALEQKYAALNKPLFDKRAEIVTGKITVSSADVKDEDKEKLGADAASTTDDVTGIPEFWMTVLQNSEIADTILEYDLPALKHLTNIEAINHKKEYELLFHFSENEFFTNKVLKKSYVFEDNEEGSQEEPKCIVGAEIEWKKGKDLTTETITLKPKAKKGKTAKPITKVEPRASFFNFFKSVEFPDEDDEEAEENMEEFNFEFEMGDEIRERIIPMAVLYFTGEMVRMPDFNQYGEDDDDEDLDGQFDDEDFEDEDSEDDAPELVAPKKGAKAAKTAAQKKENLNSVFPEQKAGDQPPECKQQ